MTDIKSAPSGTAGFENVENADSERHSLGTYVSDVLALTKHIEVPIERQLRADESSNYAEAIAIIRDIKSLTAAQRSALEAQLERLGGHPESGFKSAWATLVGAGAAAIGGVRATKVSKYLRDDYTALSLASISYTMLHATALGRGDQTLAALAARHLEALATIVVRISKTMPLVVLQELRDDGEPVSVSAAAISTKLTHEAWQQKT
jgi:hypothetical protein